MQVVNQGTIIYGLRSEKYPESACYGIIISARCDIANCKIRRLYYLIGVEAKEWLLSDEGFNMAIKGVSSSARNNFCKDAQNHGLNGNDLLSFDEEQALAVIRAEVTGKQAAALIGKYQQCRACRCITNAERQKKINQESKHIKRFLQDVNNGVHTHLYYLPEAAFRSNGKKSKGLIIDLQEIEAVSIADMEAICKNQVDSLILDPNTAKHFSQFCWIEDDNCYTGLDGTIDSPWCEHLMQRFANGFIRIGLDGAEPDDFDELVSTM